MSDSTFIDTNVLVYLFDDGEPKKRDRARRRLASERTARDLIVSTVIVRAAAQAGCDVVLTEDLQHGQTIDGVRIENPFRA